MSKKTPEAISSHAGVAWWRRIMQSCPPDQVIGGRQRPYLLRWFLIPQNRFLNVYLHRFLRSDDDRALHDHPWWNVSLLLEGAYTEHTIRAGGVHRRCIRPAWRLETPPGNGGAPD